MGVFLTLKRRILFLSILFATVLASVAVWQAVQWYSTPVNVVLIGIDTLRADHVGCYGYGQNTTPALDEAARNGVLFKSCTSQAPWTLPSFAGVFTSLYPSQHGAQINRELRNLAVDVPRKLKDVTTLTALLKGKGLLTRGCVSNPFTGYGIDADFNEFTYHWNGADEVTDAGIAFVKAKRKKPFFLYLHYNDPHEHHLIVPAPFTKRFTPARTYSRLGGLEKFPYEYIRPNFGFDLYDARIAFTDYEVGRFLDSLKSLGLWRKTLVAVISDHGEEFWEHEKEQHDYGYDPRGFFGVGHGHSLYREVVDVVFILTGGGVPRGKTVTDNVRLIDVMPTVLDYLHVKTDTPMEGVSLKRAIDGEAVHLPAYSEGIAYGYEKKSIRLDNWKYIYSAYGQVEELFDLAKDPLEKNNLIETETKQAQAMRELITPFLEKSREESFADEEQEPIDESVRQRLKGLGYLN